MNVKNKLWALGLLALGLSMSGRRAWAGASTTTAMLSIDVTVNAGVGVTIDGAVTSTEAATITPGTPFVSQDTATVLSAATGGVLEFWKLNSTNTSDNSAGVTPWTLVASTYGASGPQTNSFAIQALFVSSNAAGGDCAGIITTNNDWNQGYAPALTYGPVYYSVVGDIGFYADQTTITRANGNPDYTSGSNKNRMGPTGTGGSGQRGLCYRIVPPASVTATDNQIVYLTVTASTQ